MNTEKRVGRGQVEGDRERRWHTPAGMCRSTLRWDRKLVGDLSLPSCS